MTAAANAPAIAPAPTRARRARTAALRAVCVLAAVVAATHLVLSLAAWRELDGQVAALRAAGLPMEFAAVAPSPVAEDEDAAPLLTRAFVAETTNDHPYVPGVELGVPLPGVAAARDWVGVTSGRHPRTEALAREFLASEDCASIVALAHQAAARPHCRFAADYGQGLDMRLPELGALHTTARLVLGRAEVAGTDPAEAAADALALGALLREQPLLISQMVAASIDSLALRQLRRALAEGAVPAERAAVLEPRLARAREDVPALIASLDCERLLFARIFDHVPDAPGIDARALGWLYGSFIGYPARAHDHACYLRILGGARQRLAREGLAAGGGDDPDPGRLAPLTRLVAPAMSREATSTAEHHARVDLARIALALTRHRAERGAYPERLAELAPAYLDAVPLEPGGHATYGYERGADGGCVVSSAILAARPKGDPDARWSLR